MREILVAKGGTVGENYLVILPKFRLPRKFRDLSHAANLRHGTDGFTSPPKESMLRIFNVLIYNKILYCQGHMFRLLLGHLQAL